MDEVSDARKLVRAHGLQQAREIGDGRFIDVRPQHEAQATHVHLVRWVTERAAQQSDTIAQPHIRRTGSPPIGAGLLRRVPKVTRQPNWTSRHTPRSGRLKQRGTERGRRLASALTGSTIFEPLHRQVGVILAEQKGEFFDV
jgi:hypothetical protein